MDSYHDDNYTFDEFMKGRKDEPIIFRAKRCTYNEKNDCKLIENCVCRSPLPSESGEYCLRCEKPLTA